MNQPSWVISHQSAFVSYITPISLRELFHNNQSSWVISQQSAFVSYFTTISLRELFHNNQSSWVISQQSVVVNQYQINCILGVLNATISSCWETIRLWKSTHSHILSHPTASYRITKFANKAIYKDQYLYHNQCCCVISNAVFRLIWIYTTLCWYINYTLHLYCCALSSKSGDCTEEHLVLLCPLRSALLVVLVTLPCSGQSWIFLGAARTVRLPY